MKIKMTKSNRVTLPVALRQQLGILPGDYLLVEVVDNSIVLTPQPRTFSQRLRGLHRDVWKEVDVDAYLRHERDAWERPR